MGSVMASGTAIFLLEFCIQKLAFKDYLKAKHPDDHENRWANVEELLNQAADIGSSGSDASGTSLEESLPEIDGLQRQQLDGNDEALASFLANITLSSDLQATEDGGEQENVTISTIHSAKGLEWPVVFIPAVFDGSIPHSRSEDTDEERRLLYVAMTRAQALLYLSYPLRQPRDNMETTLSPFLPWELHKHFMKLGPDVTDKTVRDMALVLRRTPPSQAELISGLKNLSENESSHDNLWLEDGSSNPRKLWNVGGEARPALKKLKFDGCGLGGSGVLQRDKLDNRSRCFCLNTSMNSSTSFTVAGTEAGFSTAAHFLTMGKSGQFRDESKLNQGLGRDSRRASRSKSERPKAVAGQQSLASLFVRAPCLGSASCDSQLDPQLGFSGNLFKQGRPVKQEIPAALMNHEISHNSAFLKRPEPLRETSNTNRTPYVFLSSSPTQEEFERQPSDTDLACNSILTASGGGENHSPAAPKSSTSMHTTSMDISQQQNTGAPRRTYGVRRTMNGWENRKNK